MRIVYFGSGAFGLPTFDALCRDHDVALVVTQPDRPAGRKRVPTPTPIGEVAASRDIPTIKPEYVNDPDVVRAIHDTAADAYVVIAFGQKLGVDLLGETFAINLHGSLLPKYRGAAPIQWAMIEGETETGVSVITLAQRMDAGAVLARTSSPIDPRETAGELHDRLAELGPRIVLNVLSRHMGGTLEPIEQEESQATRAPKLAKADGVIDFDQPAERVRARVHGLTPWPGCTIRIDGRDLRLNRVESCPEPADPRALPGTVLVDLRIACNPGSVGLLEVQPPGRKVMAFSAYYNGHPITPGTRIESP